MLSSLMQYNFPKLGDLVLGNEAAGTAGWNLAQDLFNPGGSNGNLTRAMATNIFGDLAAKSAAGFPVTFGDYWARALSYHFLPGTTPANFYSNAAPNHAASLTYSGVTQLSSFKDYSLPFPIIVGDAYSVNRNADESSGYVPLTRTVYEVSCIVSCCASNALADADPISRCLPSSTFDRTPYASIDLR
jgi:lysophospholipase